MDVRKLNKLPRQLAPRLLMIGILHNFFMYSLRSADIISIDQSYKISSLLLGHLLLVYMVTEASTAFKIKQPVHLMNAPGVYGPSEVTAREGPVSVGLSGFHHSPRLAHPLTIILVSAISRTITHWYLFQNILETKNSCKILSVFRFVIRYWRDLPLISSLICIK